MGKLFVRFNEHGDITTFGDVEDAGQEVEKPSDWEKFSILKYIRGDDGVSLKVRDGWVDPEETSPSP